MEAPGRSELHGLRISSPNGETEAADKARAEAGPDSQSMSALGGSIGITQEQSGLRGHGLWSLWSGRAGP